MSDVPRGLLIELDGLYAHMIAAEAASSGRSETAVVQRALALYAIVGEAVESGQQLVLQCLFDEPGEPLLRIDHYLPPAPSTDLNQKPASSPADRTHAELAAWPPPV